VATRQVALIVANGGRLRADVRRLLQGQGDGTDENGTGLPEHQAHSDQDRDRLLVIATDGAAARLVKHGIIPDLVVGDFDSLPAEALPQLPPDSLIHVPDQDRCDLDKAIATAIERGYRHLKVVGALGRRWDHSLTAISLLMRYANQAQIDILRGPTLITAVTERRTIHGAVGDRLSLVAFAPVHGVTLTGVAWRLHGATIEPGSLGVSNRMTASEAELSVGSGCVVVCHEGELRGES